MKAFIMKWQFVSWKQNRICEIKLHCVGMEEITIIFETQKDGGFLVSTSLVADKMWEIYGINFGLVDEYRNLTQLGYF